MSGERYLQFLQFPVARHAHHQFCGFVAAGSVLFLHQPLEAEAAAETGGCSTPYGEWSDGCASEKIRRTDEVGYVQNTFRQMQERIRQHIADITHLTDVLRQRNEDLKLAYEQAREADRMKDAVILNMSDRMEQSVKGIHVTVGESRQHVADMDAEECCHMAEKIGRYTETTTDLLGNLLDIADRKKKNEEECPC